MLSRYYAGLIIARALALCRLGCTRIVAHCIVQSMRRNDRGVRVARPQIWMRVAAAEARNSRTFRSRGYRLPASSASITIKRFDRIGGVLLQIYRQRRPHETAASTECRPVTGRRSADVTLALSRCSCFVRALPPRIERDDKIGTRELGDGSFRTVFGTARGEGGEDERTREYDRREPLSRPPPRRSRWKQEPPHVGP